MLNRFISLTFIFFIVFLLGCSKNDDSSSISLEQYISDHNLTATDGPQGLKYIKHNTTTGASPQASDNVTIIYAGKFTDDKLFDSSNGAPVTFALGNLIQGWQLGLPLMNVGEQMTLFVPYELGYGENGYGSIPPKSDLIFDIELVATSPR